MAFRTAASLWCRVASYDEIVNWAAIHAAQAGTLSSIFELGPDVATLLERRARKSSPS